MRTEVHCFYGSRYFFLTLYLPRQAVIPASGRRACQLLRTQLDKKDAGHWLAEDERERMMGPFNSMLESRHA